MDLAMEGKMITCFYNSKLRSATLGLVIAMAGVASADQIHFTGSTQGQFDAQAFANTNSVLDLTYHGSTFDNDTVGGALDLGGNPSPGTDFNNLGSFTLGLTPNIYDGNTFKIFFTAPSSIVGGNSTVFVDMLSGSVNSAGDGGVFIKFSTPPQTFTYANATAFGTFTLGVNDVSIAPGQSASLTGHITGSQSPVPEPAVLAGLGCGVLGLIRRKKTNK